MVVAPNKTRGAGTEDDVDAGEAPERRDVVVVSAAERADRADGMAVEQRRGLGGVEAANRERHVVADRGRRRGRHAGNGREYVAQTLIVFALHDGHVDVRVDGRAGLQRSAARRSDRSDILEALYLPVNGRLERHFRLARGHEKLGCDCRLVPVGTNRYRVRSGRLPWERELTGRVGNRRCYLPLRCIPSSTVALGTGRPACASKMRPEIVVPAAAVEVAGDAIQVKTNKNASRRFCTLRFNFMLPTITAKRL